MPRRALVLFVLLILSLSTGSAFAQGGNSVAGVRSNQIIIHAPDGSETAIALPDGYTILSLAWNQTGTQLVATLYDANYQLLLWTVDAQGTTPVLLQSGPLESGFPAIFTPDGNIIYVQQQPADMQDMANYHVNINVIAPTADAQPQTYGQIPFMVGCGGGSPLPGDWVYWQEAGFGGSYVYLQATDFGILHSLVCSGEGLGLFNPQTGEDQTLIPGAVTDSHISRFKLSPDGKTVAAIKTVYGADASLTASLVLFDLSSGTLTEMAPAQQPEQLAWASDGTLYYSSRVATGDILSSLTAEQLQAFEAATGGTGMSISTWRVSINHLDPATNQEQAVYESDAYQVGRMSVSADGGLWFSLIPNQTAWVNAIINGAGDLMATTSTTMPVSVYRLDPTSGAAELVSDNLSQFAVKP